MYNNNYHNNNHIIHGTNNSFMQLMPGMAQHQKTKKHKQLWQNKKAKKLTDETRLGYK